MPGAKILVLFYSTYGHLWRMAEAAADGVKQAGGEPTVKRVPETLPVAVLEKMGAIEAQKQFEHIPIADPNELGNYDGFIFAVPTRFGMMPAQMKSFIDATGALWMTGGLVGKAASVIVSTASQHGGQESTILSFHTVLLHHGLVVVGLPYAFQGQMGLDEIKGGSPYGATTIAGGKGERLPTETDKAGATFQGKHVATIAAKLVAK